MPEPKPNKDLLPIALPSSPAIANTRRGFVVQKRHKRKGQGTVS